jgi:hypothetical protein
MTWRDLALLRLANQQITATRYQEPAQVVATLGAVQAQDYLGTTLDHWPPFSGSRLALVSGQLESVTFNDKVYWMNPEAPSSGKTGPWYFFRV